MKKTAQELALHFLHAPVIQTADGSVTPMEWLYPGFKHPHKHKIEFGPQKNGHRLSRETITDPGSNIENLEGRYGFYALRHATNKREIFRMEEHVREALEKAPWLEEIARPMMEAFPQHGQVWPAWSDLLDRLHEPLNRLSTFVAFHWGNEPSFVLGEATPSTEEEQKELEALNQLIYAILRRDEFSFAGPTQHGETYIDHGCRAFNVENIDACLTYDLLEQINYIARHGTHNPTQGRWDHEMMSESIINGAVGRMQELYEALEMDDELPNPHLVGLQQIFDRVNDMIWEIKDSTARPQPHSTPLSSTRKLEF